MGNLIIQSIQGDVVTIVGGKVPVILMNGNYATYVPATINFLRCGCREVQLTETFSSNNFDEGYLEQFEKLFKELEKPKEMFLVSAKFPVLSVSRRVEE